MSGFAAFRALVWRQTFDSLSNKTCKLFYQSALNQKIMPKTNTNTNTVAKTKTNFWQPFKQNIQIVSQSALNWKMMPKTNTETMAKTKTTVDSRWNKACKLFYLCALNTSLANLLNPPAFIFIGNSLLLVEIKRPIVVQYILAQQPHVSFGKQERFVLFLLIFLLFTLHLVYRIWSICLV